MTPTPPPHTHTPPPPSPVAFVEVECLRVYKKTLGFEAKYYVVKIVHLIHLFFILKTGQLLDRGSPYQVRGGWGGGVYGDHIS